MPSKSIKQHSLMSAVANNPQFAKKVGIPVKVGKEFVSADKKKKHVKSAKTKTVKVHPKTTKVST